MRLLKLSFTLAFLGLLLAVFPAYGAIKQRTGPDSFLPWRAYSVEDVVKQVESDPVVRKRLAKHFHVSEAGLASYFRNNLRIVYFTRTGWEPVYGVTKNGRIYRSRDYFREGGKAFGLPDGTPVLKYACGNPLITKLPPVPREKIVEAPPPLPEITPPQPPVEAFPEVVTPNIHTPEEYALLPAAPLAPAFAAQAVPVAAHHALPWWLLGAPLLGGGGGGGDDPPPPVVPEPTTIALFSAGLAALGGRFLRRRR